MRDRDKNSLAEPIVRKLSAVARLIRNYLLIESALWIAIWCMVVFWLGGMLDYLPVTAGASETPRSVRMVILVVMGLGVLWILATRLFNRLFAPLPEKSLALLVERKYPELNNELMTAVELSQRPMEEISNPAAYQQMLARVRDSVSQRMAAVDPKALLNWQPIWGAGIAFALGSVVMLIAALGMPTWMLQWCERLFALSDEPWPRRARLMVDGIQLQLPAFTGQLAAERILLPFDDGVARVPMGSAALLQISADTQADAVPEVCTFFYRGQDGTRGRANFRRMGAPTGDRQQFTLDGPPLDGLNHDLTFDVVGLDARLRDLNLQVIEPAIVTEVQLECRYPAYLVDSLSSRAAVERLPYRSGQRVPQGTQLNLLGKSSRKLRDVQYVVRGSANSAADSSLQIQSVAPTDDTFVIPLGELESSLVVEIRVRDEFGLSSDQIPRYLITMQEDSLPEVESRLEGIGIAVTPNAILPVRGTVRDDYGVHEVMLEMARNEDEPLKVPLQLTDDELLKSEVDLVKLAESGQLQLAPGMTLGLVVSARDRFDLQGKQHVGLGQPQQLAVVTPDKLGVILDRQELESRQRLELIISEVEQLRDALQDTVTTLSKDKSAIHPRASTPPWSSLQVDASENKPLQPPEVADAALQLRRIAALRAQQAVLQGDKSEQELSSIALRVDSIRLQLINNRIDSTDRQSRLQEKVHQPLVALLEGPYKELQRRLLDLQTATSSQSGGERQARESLESVNQVLRALEAIKANMLDIESYAEIVDLVRGLLDDQEKILSETEKQQKQRILDSFK